MARTAVRKSKPAEPECIEVRYALDELPSAQHKAGLAGLLLQIDSMAERKEAGALPADAAVPEVLERSAKTTTIRFTRRSVLALFDDVYDAMVVEQPRKQKQKDKEPKRIIQVEVKDHKSGKAKHEKRYIYDAVQPLGLFLHRYTSNGKEDWHKLWRDALLTVLRNRDASLGPLKDMAQLRLSRGPQVEWERMAATRRRKDTRSNLYCREGIATWDDLLRFAENSGEQDSFTELSGAIFLGVQEENAERLPFLTGTDQALLLHFWPLAVRVFVPEVIDPDGRREFAGFVLAIPDVADLVAFCRAYTRLLNALDPKKRGYRPADAVISLPAHGPLEFMRALDDLVAQRIIAERPAAQLAGVEFFHMVPAGQNVKLMAHGRVPPESRLLIEYGSLRHHCKNPLLLSCRLLSVLRREPWFAALPGQLAQRPWWFFTHSSQERNRTPQAMAGFAWEVDQKFKAIRHGEGERRRGIREHTPKEDEVAEIERESDTVDRLVYELVGGYVKERACARKGIKPDDTEWWSKTAEERRDVCSKLFLELRSRNDDDFVRHFTATLGSVPQWLDGAKFLAVAGALMRPFTDADGEHRPRTRDDVKTLTLLALSAHSRSYTPRDSAGDDAATPDEDADR